MKQKLQFFFAILSLILILVQPTSLQATNDWFVSLFNQVKDDKFCRQVTADDVYNLPLKENCELRKLDPKNMTLIGDDVLVWIVEQEAVKLKLNKDRCLKSILHQITADPSKCGVWHILSAKAWLLKRRAELTYDLCRKFLDVQHMTRIPKYDSPPPEESVQQLWRNKIRLDSHLKLNKTCSNPDTLAVLKNSNSLFELMIPYLQSDAFFKIIETQRADILMSTPNPHPLTDQEILDIDFSKFNSTTAKQIKFKADSQLCQKINKEIKSYEDKTGETITSFENSLEKGSTYHLSDDLKDKIYEDGSLMQSLEDLKLVGEDNKEFSVGAACVMSHYKPSAKGEATEFILSSAVNWLTAAKFLSYGKSFSNLSKWQKFKNTFLISSAPVGLTQSKQAIQKYCLGKENSTKANSSVMLDSLSLPEDLPFHSIKYSPGKNDDVSCKNLENKNWFYNQETPFNNSNCIFMGVSALLPFEAIFPATLNTLTTEE